jgi:hypothetical protein
LGQSPKVLLPKVKKADGFGVTIADGGVGEIVKQAPRPRRPRWNSESTSGQEAAGRQKLFSRYTRKKFLSVLDGSGSRLALLVGCGGLFARRRIRKAVASTRGGYGAQPHSYALNFMWGAFPHIKFTFSRGARRGRAKNCAAIFPRNFWVCPSLRSRIGGCFSRQSCGEAPPRGGNL